MIRAPTLSLRYVTSGSPDERRGHNRLAMRGHIHGKILPMQPEGFFARFRWGRK